MTKLSSSKYQTSPLSQFCDEHLGQDFHFLDGDEVLFRHSSQPIVYARESGVLRVIESKLPGETIRRSQRETLPLLAGALKMAVDAGLLAKGSGVFIVEGQPPYKAGAVVSQVRPSTEPRDWLSIGIQFDHVRKLSALEMRTFIRCRLLKAEAA